MTNPEQHPLPENHQPHRSESSSWDENEKELRFLTREQLSKDLEEVVIRLKDEGDNKITIVGSDNDTYSLEITTIVSAQNQSEADGYLQKHKPTIVNNQKSIDVSAPENNTNPNNVSSRTIGNIKINAPIIGGIVQIGGNSNYYGDVTINGQKIGANEPTPQAGPVVKKREVVLVVPKTTSKLTLESISGAIDLSNLDNLGGEIKTISGNITFKNVKNGEKLVETKVESTSGSIESENTEADLDVKTKSGDILLIKHKGKVIARTVSGEVHLEEFQITKTSEISSVSGRIHVGLDTSSQLRLNAQTTSGKITKPRTNFNLTNEEKDKAPEIRGAHVVINWGTVQISNTSGHKVEGIYNQNDSPTTIDLIIKNTSGNITVV